MVFPENTDSHAGNGLRKGKKPGTGYKTTEISALSGNGYSLQEENSRFLLAKKHMEENGMPVFQSKISKMQFV